MVMTHPLDLSWLKTYSPTEVYIQEIKDKSSASRLFSSLKATHNKICSAYIVRIDGKWIFTKADALYALTQLYNDHAMIFEIEFAPEKHLTASQLRKALVEHDIFQPDEPEDAEHVAQILLEDIHAIAAIHFPNVDFYDPSVSTNEIAVHINAIQSQSLTPEEEALGHFMHGN